MLALVDKLAGGNATRTGMHKLACLCSWCAAALPVGEARRHSINREVLLAMTAGRLVLCDKAEMRELVDEASLRPGPIDDAAPSMHEFVTGPQCLPSMRDSLKTLAAGRMCQERIWDLLTCATEAVTNALKYAGDATIRAWLNQGAVFVLVSDQGTGIPPNVLTRATLETGFSTRDTLGMGFTLMLAMSDRLTLRTTSDGTDVLIEIHAAQPA